MFAEDKSGTGFGVKVNVTPPNLLLIGNVTFVIGSDNEFNVSWFFCFFVFRDRVFLCSPGCPGTYSVGQAGLELTEILLLLPPKLRRS